MFIFVRTRKSVFVTLLLVCHGFCPYVSNKVNVTGEGPTAKKLSLAYSAVILMNRLNYDLEFYKLNILILNQNSFRFNLLDRIKMDKK